MDARDVSQPYPLRVEGRLDPTLSRWLWLVKWLLAIPHYIVLAFLWAAFAVMSIVAFFAIVVTARYPRSIFEFNVGVLRWTWRVVFYSYGALGTDRYPPFTLADVADYPATLEVDYPERLSRGLVLVKWWLLAIPQYLIVGVLVGGEGWYGRGDARWFLGGGGLILILVLIAGVGLLFTRRYPGGLFDFVLGLDRWVLRVTAYAGLMTDRYPPFRLDQGGTDGSPVTAEPGAEPEAVKERGWTVVRVLSVVVGCILALLSLGFLAGGAATVVVDQTQRDGDGFLMTPSQQFDTGSYALVSETLDVTVDVPQWVIDELIGTVRIRSESDQGVFVGIAPESEANAYLDGVRRAVVTDIARDPDYSVRPGGAPASAPGTQSFWVASTFTTGAGEQVVDWKVKDGKWVVVVMNTDGSAGVTADLRIGAEVDSLIWIGIGLLLAGLLLGLAAAGLIYAGIPKARASRTDSAQPQL